MIGRAGFGAYAQDRELGYTITQERWDKGWRRRSHPR